MNIIEREGIAQSTELGTDGLWARLRGGATRVVLLLVDSVTGPLRPRAWRQRCGSKCGPNWWR